ncbi:LysR substrate-binding domain-containing protein [Sinorhizobium sp. KGO-5]|uniref:LysR substrate-binding domain-containing protein n=1 Tax=Sinorhizobium sp. KGO-5 TaxID=1470810 RepID=UPI00403EB3F3
MRRGVPYPAAGGQPDRAPPPTYGVRLCAAPPYLAQRGAPQRSEDLHDLDCLGFAYGATRDRWRFCGPDGEEQVEVKFRLVANSGQALLTLSCAGLGILMQPRALVEDVLRAGNLVPLLPAYAIPSRPLQILNAPDRRATPKLRSFLDFAVAKFGRSED